LCVPAPIRPRLPRGTPHENDQELVDQNKGAAVIEMVHHGDKLLSKGWSRICSPGSPAPKKPEGLVGRPMGGDWGHSRAVGNASPRPCSARYSPRPRRWCSHRRPCSSEMPKPSSTGTKLNGIRAARILEDLLVSFDHRTRLYSLGWPMFRRSVTPNRER